MHEGGHGKSTGFRRTPKGSVPAPSLFEELLPRAQHQRPGEVELPHAGAGNLIVQRGGNASAFPEDAGAMAVAVDEAL